MNCGFECDSVCFYCLVFFDMVFWIVLIEIKNLLREKRVFMLVLGKKDDVLLKIVVREKLNVGDLFFIFGKSLLRKLKVIFKLCLFVGIGVEKW